jgi:uncharacterized OsmC-like protein
VEGAVQPFLLEIVAAQASCECRAKGAIMASTGYTVGRPRRTRLRGHEGRRNVSIADSVAKASAYLTDHADEARYRDSYARASLESGLLVSVVGPGGEALRTDMPAGIGGTATAPSPGWFLRAAAASCVASLVAIRAAATGVTLRSVVVEVDSESDDRGILGLDDAIPAGALSTRVVLTIDAAGLDRPALEALGSWAVEHCPVTSTISRSAPLEIEVR